AGLARGFPDRPLWPCWHLLQRQQIHKARNAIREARRATAIARGPVYPRAPAIISLICSRQICAFDSVERCTISNDSPAADATARPSSIAFARSSAVSRSICERRLDVVASRVPTSRNSGCWPLNHVSCHQCCETGSTQDRYPPLSTWRGCVIAPVNE